MLNNKIKNYKENINKDEYIFQQNKKDLVKERSWFVYLSSVSATFKKSHLFSVFCILFLLSSMFFVFFAFLFQYRVPPPQYFALNNINQFLANKKPAVLSKISVLNSPVLSSQKIQNWSMHAVESIFSFDFTNSSTHFLNISYYFSNSGWSVFSNAIKNTTMLQEVIKQKLMVSATPLGNAYVSSEPYLLGGKMVWPSVTVPVLITFTGASPPAPIKSTVILTIVQVNATSNPDAIKIAALNMSVYQK